MRVLTVSIDAQRSLDHLILEGNALRIVRLEPPLCGFEIGKRLDVIGVADVVLVSTYIQTVIGLS